MAEGHGHPLVRDDRKECCGEEHFHAHDWVVKIMPRCTWFVKAIKRVCVKFLLFSISW
jgi:hypothetical protein